MLTRLTIKNYALIEELDTAFNSGFITITGETGAGKSILLGALSLVLGKRADLASLRDSEKKCIVEAEFAVANYQLNEFFSENELDYEDNAILRREILPSGKSRAFINDSPVNLGILAALGSHLVDVHSQHETLMLTENNFQFKVIDAYAGTKEKLVTYRKLLGEYRTEKQVLEKLLSEKLDAQKELDYNSFLFQELTDAKLVPGMQEELELEFGTLSNVESILENLAIANQLTKDETIGISPQLSQLKRTLSKISNLGKDYNSLLERVNSAIIEFDDIIAELETLNEGIEPDPKRLEEVNSKLGLLHDLMKKHQTSSVDDLINIQDELGQKVNYSSTINATIESKTKSVEKKEAELNKLASEIRKSRIKTIPKLKETLENKLTNLGMSSASFNIAIEPAEDFKHNGKDDLAFLFSANKGSKFEDLKKVASGGELSRIMLVIKSVLADYDRLPTLMFDEIDTGVSGDISTKMGAIMKKMGDAMQVFSITHLPQVAAQGNHQYRVFKEEGEERTRTYLKKLNDKERVEELAEMLGGKAITETALSHAKKLLSLH